MEELSRGKQVGRLVSRRVPHTTQSSSLPCFVADLPRAFNRARGKMDKMMATRRKEQKRAGRGSFGQY